MRWSVCSIAKRSKRFIVKFLAFSTHTHNSLMDSSFQESAQELFLLPPTSTPKIGRKRIERHLMSSSILREFSTSARKRLRDPRHSFVFFIPQPKKRGEGGKKKLEKCTSHNEKTPRRVIQFFHSSSSRNFVIGSRLNITYEFHFFIK